MSAELAGRQAESRAECLMLMDNLVEKEARDDC